MKSTLVLFLFSLVSIAKAQEDVNPDKYETDFSDFKPHIIHLPYDSLASERISSLQPRNVTVLDYRFDTTTLGFINKKVPKKRNLVLEQGTCAGIERFLKQQLLVSDTGSSNQYELVMVLQKLWLSDDVFIPKSDPVEYQDSLRSGVIVKAAYFLKAKDAYFPLYRFDSTIVDTDRLRRNAGDYLAGALTASMQKLARIKVERILQSGKKYDFAYINDLYKTRFTLPVLLQQPRKGVYLTFEEFKKNQPSITEYSLKSDESMDNLYYKDQSGKEVFLRKLYAFSDGKDFFLWSTDNFYRLYRSGNTFNLFGARSFLSPATKPFLDPRRNSYTTYDGKGGTGPPLKNRDIALKYKMRYYQLDMETGLFN